MSTPERIPERTPGRTPERTPERTSGSGRRRFGILALVVCIAIFATLALRAALLAGPAFNRDLRVEGPWGGWRSSTGIALYYENRYLREHAHNWLLIAAERADVEAAAEARALLRRSLALAPANAFAWTELAWSEVALRDARAARDALLASWRVAPYSADLAVSRLLLATTLSLEAGSAALPPIRRDLAVARRMAPEAYAALIADRPGLRALAREEEAPPEG